MSVLGTNLGDLWPYNGRAVALVGISCVVVVVFLLSDEEVDWLFEGGNDRLVVDIAHVGDDGHSFGSLFFGKRHDARTVLGADIVALTVELGRVVDGKEHLEKGFVGHNARVKHDLHDFSVPG